MHPHRDFQAEGATEGMREGERVSSQLSVHREYINGLVKSAYMYKGNKRM